jgi:hypothetical protein
MNCIAVYPKNPRDFSGLHMAIWAMGRIDAVEEPLDNLPSDNKSADRIYDEIVQDMQDLCDDEISTAEAHDAARNLIGFCQTVLAIKRRLEQDKKHAELH